MIVNRLYNKGYSNPSQFWQELGQVFKNCRAYYNNEKHSIRKLCDCLRTLAYYLFDAWYREDAPQFLN